MQRYYSLSDYCKEEYGKKLYRLSLDAGFTCPNRDGKKGVGGCIFCSEQGSGDFSFGEEDISERLSSAKALLGKKAKNCGYIAYFQSYTNTYASKEALRKIYSPYLKREDIDVISIATRPDCIDAGVLKVLLEIAEKKPLWVELGLQTANDKTGMLINRCFLTEEYFLAAQRLLKAGIKVITHVIIGLPGETEEQLYKTIDAVNKAGSWGIKLQLLHVLKNTQLYEMYKKGEYNPLSKEQYFKLLSGALMRLKPKTVIHRLTGDGDKKKLVSPLWSADKKRVLNDMNRYFTEHDVVEGSLYKEK